MIKWERKIRNLSMKNSTTDSASFYVSYCQALSGLNCYFSQYFPSREAWRREAGWTMKGRKIDELLFLWNDIDGLIWAGYFFSIHIHVTLEHTPEGNWTCKFVLNFERRCGFKLLTSCKAFNIYSTSVFARTTF